MSLSPQQSLCSLPTVPSPAWLLTRMAALTTGLNWRELLCVLLPLPAIVMNGLLC
jgi:hypothetical protein